MVATEDGLVNEGTKYQTICWPDAIVAVRDVRGGGGGRGETHGDQGCWKTDQRDETGDSYYSRVVARVLGDAEYRFGLAGCGGGEAFNKKTFSWTTSLLRQSSILRSWGKVG